MTAPTQVLIHVHGVDVNRGAIIRQGICMHKDDPGIYFTKSGYEVSEKVAKAHGYDVDRFRKARAKKIRLDAAMREIEVEFGDAKAAIESEFVDPTAGKKTDSEVVIARSVNGNYPMETATFLMFHKGRGKWTVKDKQDGHKERIEATTRDVAIDWMIRHEEEAHAEDEASGEAVEVVEVGDAATVAE